MTDTATEITQNFDGIELHDEEKNELLRNASLNFATHVHHDSVDTFIEDAAKIYNYLLKGLDSDQIRGILVQQPGQGGVTLIAIPGLAT